MRVKIMAAPRESWMVASSSERRWGVSEGKERWSGFEASLE